MAQTAESSTSNDRPYLLGIDVGTSSVSVGIFDAAGTPVVIRSEEFTTEHPRSGWAEQDPGDWWSATVKALRAALDEEDVDASRIKGISVDATSSTVLAVGEDGDPLRPAIMWMDVRASDQAQRVQESGHAALKYNGFGAVSAEWGLPKILWLVEKQPDVFERSRYIVDCIDWFMHRLTGRWASSVNIQSAKYYYDRDEGGRPDDLYEQVGAGEALDRLPGDVLDLGEVVGELREDVAEELGLRAGTPVAQGGIDAYVGALGLGVVEPGKIALITGSSHVMIAQAAEPVHAPGLWGAYTDALLPGQYTIEAGQASTGSVVAWFKNKFAGDAVAEAKKRGVDPYDVLTEWALKVPEGSDGLIVLDYFQGNRSPHVDPLARGMFWGLSLSHGPGHLFRAIIEGICYGTEDVLRTMRDAGFDPSKSVVSGGPTASDLWMQLHADVSNIPIGITRVTEGPVLGGAMLAAVGAGIYDDIPAASEHMVHTERTIEPDQERHERYKFFVDRYIETYDQMKDSMHTTVRHVAESDGDSA